MGRSPVIPREKRTRIVLSILAGEDASQPTRRADPSTTSCTDTTSAITSTTYDVAGRDTATSTTAPGGGISTLGHVYLDDGWVSTLTVDAVTVVTLAYDAATAEATGVTYAATGAGALTLGGRNSDVGTKLGTAAARERWSVSTSMNRVVSMALPSGGKYCLQVFW